MVSLEEAISSYEKAIQNIASGDSDDPQSQALSVFTARDTIAQILSQNPSAVPEALVRISKLDENLKRTGS